MPELLLEIGLEEIPARMIAAAEAELARRVEALLTRAHLLDAGAVATSYSTPRRLAVRVEGVLARQLDIQEQLTGPSWKAAFPNGQPGPAAQAFAKKAGVAVAVLEKITTPKGEYAAATVQRLGQSAEKVLSDSLPQEIGALTWPKTMYWRLNKPERFVRPLRWLLCLLDESVVPLEFAGIHAGNVSYGHRVLHGDTPVPIARPADYLDFRRCSLARR
jgi:glycyl-tRNA synthetase beta chain